MEKHTNGIEIAALVLGIVSIPLACLHALLGTIVAVIGIVLGAKARKTYHSTMAMAGLICAIVGCVFGVLNFLAGAFLIYMFMS